MLKLPRIISKNLSVRLSLMVVCVIALLLSVSLAVMFNYSRQTLQEEAMYDAEQTLEGTVQQIDNILLSVEQASGNIYWDLMAHLDQPERMFTYSRNLVECNPYIVGCAIVFKPYYFPDREFFMAYVRRKGNSVTTDEDTELEVRNTFTNRPYTEQVWYTEPMKTGRACWTDPLKNEDTEDEPLTTFCLPIYDKGMECVGVVAVDLSIGLLSQIVLAAKPSTNSYSTLLARNGSFIVHPDQDKLLHQTVFTQFERGADRSLQEAAKTMVAGETGSKRFRMNGRDWYVFYKPFKQTEVRGRSMEELGWSVGVVYPEDDIFGEYNRLLYYLIAIAVGGLLFFFVLCRLFTRHQLLPLNLLTYSTQRIAKGNYGETIPDTKRKDEIGQLQGHFQQMQKSLSAQIGELETLSASLQESSEVLRMAYSKAQEADRMKTAFLHNMTNQMIMPAEAIEKSVTNLCNGYPNISQENADREVNTIQQQSTSMLDLLDNLIHTAENETGKEDAHE